MPFSFIGEKFDFGIEYIYFVLILLVTIKDEFRVFGESFVKTILVNWH